MCVRWSRRAPRLAWQPIALRETASTEPESHEKGLEFLFDLTEDVREQANLLDKRPDDVNTLRQAWDAWTPLCSRKEPASDAAHEYRNLGYRELRRRPAAGQGDE